MNSNDKLLPVALVDALSGQRTAFKAFITSRVGSASDAEDILQNSLAKAVRSADTLQDPGKARAWFYQLLRNAIIDHHRSRCAMSRRDDSLGELMIALQETATPPAAWEPQLCVCLDRVIDTLNSLHTELLRRVDLNGESVQVAAGALDLTPNHASVILHRARKSLRTRLETFCGNCADSACLDCDCANSETEV